MSTQKMIDEMNNFIKNLDVEKASESAECVALWDFNTSLGTSLSEKYDTLFVKILEVSSVLMTNGAKGFFWTLCTPEISTMMQVHPTFRYGRKRDDYRPMEIVNRSCIGVLDRRWRTYVGLEMGTVMLVGHDCNLDNIARIRIANHYV